MNSRAVVLGAGMGGLLAAGVLCDHFDAVTVVERDPTVDPAGPRPGVPQGRHVHGLLAGGAEVIEQLWPGALDAIASAEGLPPGPLPTAGRWVVRGTRMRTV